MIDFFRWMAQDLMDDGYSLYFGMAFLLSCIPLIWDVARHGWTLEEDSQ